MKKFHNPLAFIYSKLLEIRLTLVGLHLENLSIEIRDFDEVYGLSDTVPGRGEYSEILKEFKECKARANNIKQKIKKLGST